MSDKKNNSTSDDKNQTINQMWGGRFSMGASDVMDAINVSIDIDKKLYEQDIKGSLAHSEMLANQGIITKQDAKQIAQGLDKIAKKISAGEFKFIRELEDIHMNIEYALKEEIGTIAGRLHTARSRNDQVATDFRLYVCEAIDELQIFYDTLLNVLLQRAEETADMVMPGFTHLQTAQPITLGHHLMAYVEMFFRDKERFADCRKRVNQSPLGAVALAGTSFPIDRHMTAEKLGFDFPMRNSLDAVSARDFALEFLSSCSIASMHLTRLAEELVLWSSAQFGYITISDNFTSGSSVMPQKKNPDAAELVRAKSGRILGSFITLMHVMKALPLAYSKDMQEDKPPVFDAYDSLSLMLKATAGMMQDATFHADKMLDSLQHGFPEATDLADWLVQKLNIPFRDAHHITGSAVMLAEQKKCRLNELSLAELQQFHEGITEEIFTVLDVQRAVETRTSFGGTAPICVRDAINEARKRL